VISCEADPVPIPVSGVWKGIQWEVHGTVVVKKKHVGKIIFEHLNFFVWPN
jgi:hypothetical protein